MNNSEIRIALDEPSARYLAGQRVRGAVEIHSRERSSCRITIRARWGISTRNSSGGTEEVEIHGGECEGGVATRVPFDVELPRGPLSYEGTLVNAVWWLEARAQMERGGERTITETITVYSDGSVEPEWGSLYDSLAFSAHPVGELLEEVKPGEAPQRMVIKPTRPMKLGCLACGLAPVILAVLLVVGLLVKSLAGGDLQSVVIILVALAFGGFALSRFLWTVFLGNWFARRRLGDVQLDGSPRLARGGDPITFQVSFTPQKSVVIDGAVAALEAEELHDRGRESRRHRYRRHTVMRTEVEFSQERELAAGLPAVLGGTIRVPDTPPASFGAEDNELSWRLSVRVRIRGGADWESTRLLLIYP